MRFLLLLSALIVLPFSSLKAETLTYMFDPLHTNIVWKADHFGFSSPSGRFGITEGKLLLDDKNPEGAKLDITIDVTKLTTGIDKFDNHLKSDDFLHADKYPTARFVSTDIKKTGRKTANITGDLTLHGVTKPVTLKVKLNKLGMHPYSQKKTVGFSGRTTLKRSEFGISRYSPNIGEEVHIAIEAEANVKQEGQER